MTCYCFAIQVIDDTESAPSVIHVGSHCMDDPSLEDVKSVLEYYTKGFHADPSRADRFTSDLDFWVGRAMKMPNASMWNFCLAGNDDQVLEVIGLTEAEYLEHYDVN